MKNFTPKLLALTVSVLPLFADSRTVDWSQICDKADDQQIIVTTRTGEAIAGDCQRVTDSELSVKTGAQTGVRIGRGDISKVRVRREKGYKLRSWLVEAGASLLWGAYLLISPVFPAGIVWIPATLAWGAVTLPFYAIDDLVRINAAPTEIYSQ